MDSASAHKISWNGEWLPMELWTKVFYYMLVPSHCNTFGAHTRNEIEILKRHPRIAEIIAEYLLFRTGLTHAYLEQEQSRIVGHWIPITSPNQFAFRYSLFKKRTQDSSGEHQHIFSLNGIRIVFNPHSISIDLGILRPRSYKKSLTGSGYAKFSPDDLRKIRAANSVLPYGLHFRQIRGVLHLRMPNNPRLGGSKFRYIRSFEVNQDVIDPQLGEWLYCVDEVNCTISSDELYIPSWRPYS